MKDMAVETEVFKFNSEGLLLRVFIAYPALPSGPLPSVQIHHAGGGYEPTYEEMAVELASKGIVGIAMIHRGYPGSQGSMEYGKGEIRDIGNLVAEMRSRAFIDPNRMGIMGYSRGAHNAILALERYNDFRAGALWSTPVNMVDHVQVNPWIAEMFGGYPEEIPEEYRIRSSILFTDQIACPLLLIHGEMDDVVPVRHTLRLAQALKDQQKPFELHLFPDEGHIWSLEGFNHNWDLTMDFFERHLKQTAT
ncbi:MAG: prolyl oligopeptidase family serine peptidase [Syntrophales bacterium LBB04]|nr:prolyl oligopeptidase family serine peptidase [Syntrophales bacterium LBB04]